MQFGKKIKIIKKISQDHQQLECAEHIPDSVDSTNSISSLNCSSSNKISDSPPSSKVKLMRKINISHSLSTNEIRDCFYEPAKRLIENNGYNEDGVLIADVNGAAVILEILDSILGNKKRCDGNILGLIDILEKNIEDQIIEETNEEVDEEDEEVEVVDEEDEEEEDVEVEVVDEEDEEVEVVDEEDVEEEDVEVEVVDEVEEEVIEEKVNLLKEKIEHKNNYEEDDEEKEASVYAEEESDDYGDCESYMNNISDDSMDDY